MEICKIEKFSKRKVMSLSGGERQKVWIAMVLAQKTSVLLLDEPTTYLDICHQFEIMELPPLNRYYLLKYVYLFYLYLCF